MRYSILSLLLTAMAACSTAPESAVRITGDEADARLVLRYIRAAEAGDMAAFKTMTGQSIEATFTPPEMRDVDRRDEHCVLTSLDGSVRMVSALWTYPDNTKPVVQRSFLIEHGHITHMWNNWAPVGIRFSGGQGADPALNNAKLPAGVGRPAF